MLQITVVSHAKGLFLQISCQCREISSPENRKTLNSLGLSVSQCLSTIRKGSDYKKVFQKFSSEVYGGPQGAEHCHVHTFFRNILPYMNIGIPRSSYGNTESL